MLVRKEFLKEGYCYCYHICSKEKSYHFARWDTSLEVHHDSRLQLKISGISTLNWVYIFWDFYSELVLNLVVLCGCCDV